MPERLDLTAEQIMSTNVATIQGDAPVSDVVKLLADEDIYCAMIVDGDGKPEGIVTEADLLRFAGADDKARLSKLLKQILQEEHHIFDSMHEVRKYDATNVRDMASSPVKCAEADMTLSEIASVMESYDYRQLPVVKEGRLVGIVGRQEVIKAIADQR